MVLPVMNEYARRPAMLVGQSMTEAEVGEAATVFSFSVGMLQLGDLLGTPAGGCGDSDSTMMG